MTSLLDLLEESVVGHGLVASRHGDRVLVEGGLSLGVELFDHPQGRPTSNVMLQVTARAPALGRREIVECFAGVGDNFEQASSEAFMKFLRGSFHVLLTAFAPHECDDQVEIETWDGRNGRWRVLMGPLLLQHVGEAKWAPHFSGFLALLEQRFREQAVPGLHWVRIYQGGFDGHVAGAEVLLDNESWKDGERQLAAHPWPAPTKYESFRLFLIALPEKGSEGPALEGGSFFGRLRRRFTR